MELIAYNTISPVQMPEEIPQEKTSEWIQQIIELHQCQLGEIEYNFCTDKHLHKFNVEILSHDTYTDIISFDSTVADYISGEIYISVDRVAENAAELGDPFARELRRVIIHGVLHFVGFKDKTTEEKQQMRAQEDVATSLYDKMFHVKHS